MVASPEASLTVGELLHRDRKSRGFSHAEMGLLLNRSHARVAQWENGDPMPLETELACAALFRWPGYTYPPELGQDMEDRYRAIMRLRRPPLVRGRYCGSPMHKMIQRRGAAGVKVAA